jgi:phage shock protein PspC (stress-responsive transcriptional regulator)
VTLCGGIARRQDVPLLLVLLLLLLLLLLVLLLQL